MSGFAFFSEMERPLPVVFQYRHMKITAKMHIASPFINVTPLIDVLLVLLIIFMVISPMRQGKFEAKIPQKAEAQATDSGSELVVTVESVGGYRLNSQAVQTLPELEHALARALNGRPYDMKSVFIRAPRTIDYGKVVRVIEVMKNAGSFPIGLQLENLD